MRLPGWVTAQSSRRVGNAVVVTFTADPVAYIAAMARVADLTREAESVQRYQHRIRMERLAGLAYVGQLLDAFARDVGLAGRGHCGQERQCTLTSGGCACGREVEAELVASATTEDRT